MLSFFRKPALAAEGDLTDHDFMGPLHVIWATGQAGDPFYAEDELKYHGGNKGIGKMGEFMTMKCI